MKNKLQDYSLISNEWIDNEIDRLTKVARECIADNVNADVYAHYIRCLEGVKQQLIPSYKLANVCFDKGIEYETQNTESFIHNELPKSKQDFLTSEIEIL